MAYPRDPYVMNAKLDSTCRCGEPIRKGDLIFYYPNQRSALALGKPCECGEKARRDFDAARADEAMWNS